MNLIHGYLSIESLNFDYIQKVCTAIMSKKIPRSDKYRDEIAEMEEGGLHSHEQDVRDRGLVVSSTSTVTLILAASIHSLTWSSRAPVHIGTASLATVALPPRQTRQKPAPAQL